VSEKSEISGKSTGTVLLTISLLKLSSGEDKGKTKGLPLSFEFRQTNLQPPVTIKTSFIQFAKTVLANLLIHHKAKTDNALQSITPKHEKGIRKQSTLG
jgi:hypothetical protein